MEAFSITPTLSTTPASPQATGASTAATGDAPASGLSFGGIFNKLQPDAGRQDFAAVLLGSGLPGPQLVSQPLGDAMAVITPDSPMPAQDSLLAFARSQGLDEAAIAALWQQPSAGPANGALSGKTPLNLATPGGDPSALSATASASAKTSPNTGIQPFPPMPMQLMGLVVQSLPSQSETPPSPASAPEIDPLVMQSLRLNPQAQGLRTAQRPQLQAPTPQNSVADKPPASPVQEPPTLTLDLESELAELTRAPETSSDTAAPLSAAPTTTPTSPALPEAARPQGQAPAPANAATPAHTTISGYQLKAEHYQQLADRMGQALAQRLQEQIESGQWSMKLRLNPVELGQIDVQLDMHQGGLDARFQTDNPLTKDLILQGSGRLKDSLNEHGMTVASMWVNSDDRRQSGGNSTPQQQQRRASSGQTTSRPEAVAEASAPRNSRPDGWDMMA